MPDQRHFSRRQFSSLPPLALYVHIPWCVQKCPYCDFNSHKSPAQLPEDAYISALLNDLQADLPLASKRPLSSIFIGGGTPSLFSAAALERLLNGIKAVTRWQADIEITLEANPGTFEQARFAAYRSLGINRLSMGVQSFNDAQLKKLGRIHSGTEAIRAVDIARQAGFDNLNLDLMHGLVQQTPRQALADLQQAMALAPEHLSWYQLTIEPNTAFWSQPPELPEDECLWDIQQAGQQLLREQGFAQYEISAYARNGHQARHNLNYWQFGDYLGIGAGAHGKITQPDGSILRYRKTRQPDAYLTSQHRTGENWLEDAELPFEFVMNALRLTAGVPAHLFSLHTGLPLSALQPGWQHAQERGLMLPDVHRLGTTERGALFLNDCLQIFLSNLPKD